MFDWFSMGFVMIVGLCAAVDYFITGGQYTTAVLSWVALQVEHVIHLLT